MTLDCAGHYDLTELTRRLPRVVECNLLPLPYVPLREEADPGQVGVQAVDPNVENAEVWVTGVVNKMGHIPEIGCIHRIGTVLPQVEVQVK